MEKEVDKKFISEIKEELKNELINIPSSIDYMICKNCGYYKDGKCFERTIDGKTWINEFGDKMAVQEYEETNENSNCSFWTENIEIKEELKNIYEDIIYVLKKYIDMKEENYSIVALWIIGTYYHSEFETYPYLFINAMKGSGKTRLLKIIKKLSKDGEILNSLTEAVLFRTKGTLCIDEFEGISRKGQENLRELLNSAYKKGTKVKRMKKVKISGKEEQVVEEFDVYRPIVMANIFGLENVLADRCITIILEKSENLMKTRLVEDFENNTYIRKIKNSLYNVGYVCMMSCTDVYRDWNNFILGQEEQEHTHIHTLHTPTPTYTTYTNLFKQVEESKIDGRNLELTFPFFQIANKIGEEELKNIIKIISDIVIERKEEDMISNYDISLIDFLSQEVEINYFISINEITNNFKSFLNSNDEWIRPEWMGRALKRLNLIKKRKRQPKGIFVIIDYEKAREKIKIFK